MRLTKLLGEPVWEQIDESGDPYRTLPRRLRSADRSAAVSQIEVALNDRLFVQLGDRVWQQIGAYCEEYSAHERR